MKVVKIFNYLMRVIAPSILAYLLILLLREFIDENISYLIGGCVFVEVKNLMR